MRVYNLIYVETINADGFCQSKLYTTTGRCLGTITPDSFKLKTFIMETFPKFYQNKDVLLLTTWDYDRLDRFADVLRNNSKQHISVAFLDISTSVIPTAEQNLTKLIDRISLEQNSLFEDSYTDLREFKQRVIPNRLIPITH